MCGIVGILGREPVAPSLVDALSGSNTAATIPLASPRWKAGSSRAGAPRASCATSKRRLAREPLAGSDRHRPHPLGDPRPPDRKQRAPPCHRPPRRRPQRHHREFPRVARRARSARAQNSARETDTEVVAHLVTEEMSKGRSPAEAVAAALPRLRGAFALAFLFEGEEDLLIGARKGSPLAIGYGDGEMYLGSDAIALAPFTDTISLSRGRRLGRAHARAVSTIRDAQGQQGRARGAQIVGVGVSGRQGQPSPLHGEGNSRAAGSRRPHARALSRHGGRAACACRRSCRSTSARSSACRSPPAAPPITPGWSPNTGSSALRACRSRSMSRPSSAIARRRCEPGGLAHLRLAIGRDRRHAGDAALCQGAQAARAGRSSTCRPRPSRARATW